MQRYDEGSLAALKTSLSSSLRLCLNHRIDARSEGRLAEAPVMYDPVGVEWGTEPRWIIAWWGVVLNHSFNGRTPMKYALGL